MAIAIRSKIWFEAPQGGRAFGAGLARLLEAVDAGGTLTHAARSEEMSYRHAWDLIRSAERHLGCLLLVRHPGGSGGGGSILSPEGRRLLEVFRRVSGEVADFADRRFEELRAVTQPKSEIGNRKSEIPDGGPAS